MNTRVIIAAAGPQKYWNNRFGVPTHLVKAPHPLGGTEPRIPLLERTLWLVSCFPDTEVIVTIPDMRDHHKYMEVLREFEDVKIVTRMERAYWNEYNSTETLWEGNGRTVLLLGDVFFTHEAMRTIMEYNGPTYRVFGRSRASHITHTPYGEIFAATWLSRDNDAIRRANLEVRNAYLTGKARKCEGWTLLRYIQGSPLNRHLVMGRHFTEITDETDDIDKPEDYDRHPMFGNGKLWARTLRNSPPSVRKFGGNRITFYTSAHMRDKRSPITWKREQRAFRWSSRI